MCTIDDFPVIPRFFNPVPDEYLDELLTMVPDALKQDVLKSKVASVVAKWYKN